ncbi:transposase (plasmid) [Streptomyces globisporus]|nr:transposase [Streptomyces globisporus]
MVDDELWASIEPLLAPWPERSPGPGPVSDRLCPQGILFVLDNDMAWQLLPLGTGLRLRGGCPYGFGQADRAGWG